MNTAMQMCYIVLLLTVPLLVFSCESNYYRYKHSEMVNKERTIDLSKDWMKFRISGSPESEKIDIKRFNEAYEINNMFIIYRDQDLMLLLPKSVIPEKELLIIRSYISRNIGGRFFIRKF